MTATIGGPSQSLDPDRVRDFVRAGLGPIDLDGRSLCIVIPDSTRRFPLAPVLKAVADAVDGRVRACTAVVALGTHAAMAEEAIGEMTGPLPFPVVNHKWWDASTFATVGRLSDASVAELTGGRIRDAVDVRVNRLVTESDITLIVGPVLPHEVVGYSGGHKYLFPGLSGQELIDLTHWLGALITSRQIIGTPGITPVRAVIEAAAGMVPGDRRALCGVVDHRSGQLASLAFGSPLDAWGAAAEVAAATHVRYLQRPVPRVLAMVAPRYTDLWTGAKGFYKVEPVVADGGEVVLYAPHITEVSAMHPGLLDIGYHCRDFFLAQWDRYRDHPWGELAHSTHLFGAGTYEPGKGEVRRVRVTLATAIPEETVLRVNLGYRHPASIDVAEWRSDPTALVVEDAGEVLYRLEEPEEA
ncbi:MAG: lactate racemase domain-containing protein [Actinomycetota bacterium]|nr:lactate racemase domain-containing protein [Actinomycetota bacterium]